MSMVWQQHRGPTVHESPIVRALVTRAATVVADAGAAPQRVGVRIGALSGVQERAVRSYWRSMAGPALAGVPLEVVVDDDPTAPGALGVELAYVDVAPVGE